MDSQRVIKHLEEQQARITMLLHGARDLLASGHPTAVLRWQLVRALREYQLFKHREIFDPLAGSLNPQLADLACGMKMRCIATCNAYGDHVQRWSNGAAVGKRSAARAATWHRFAIRLLSAELWPYFSTSSSPKITRELLRRSSSSRWIASPVMPTAATMR